MFLKKIKVENYKQLNIEMDLIPNNNKMKESNNYIKTHKNVFIPKIVGIGGKNAIGKTNFIEIFDLIKMYSLNPNIVPMIYKNMINNNPKIKKYINSIILKENAILQEGMHKEYLQMQTLQNLISKIIKDKKFEIESYITNSYWKALSDFFGSIHTLKANDIKRDIVFTFNLYDEKNKKDLFFKFIIKNNGVKMIAKNDLKNSNDNTLYFKRFLDSIFMSQTTMMKLSPFVVDENIVIRRGAHIHNVDYVQDILFKNKGNKIFLETIKAIDESIEDFYYDSKKQNFYIKTRSKKMPWTNLSTGTIKFLEIFAELTNKTDETKMYFIDELESNLNNKLINFLKTFIANQKNIQMIFTSHSGITLSSNMDNKQIFIFDNNFNFETEQIETISWKFSSKFSKNHSFVSMFNKGEIVSSGDTKKLSHLIDIYTDNG